MAKAPAIFFTRLKPSHISGFFGLLFTLNEHGMANGSKVYGPEGTAEFFESVQGFIGHKMLPFSFMDFSRNSCLLGIHESHTNKNKSTTTPSASLKSELDSFILPGYPKKKVYYSGFSSFNDLNHDASGNFSAKGIFKDKNLTIIPLIGKDDGFEVTSYICIPHKMPGKIDKDKIKEHNLSSIDLKNITGGGEVILQSGKVIHLKDILLPISQSAGFVIIDCPTIGIAKQLLQNQILQKILISEQNDINTDYYVKSVIHIVNSEVLASLEYQTFLQCFQKQTEHIFTRNPEFGNETISNEELEIISQNFHHQFLQNAFSKIFPNQFKFFPDLKLLSCFSSEFKEIIHHHEKKRNLIPNYLNWMFARNYYEYILNPSKSQGYHYNKQGTEFKTIEFSDDPILSNHIKNLNSMDIEPLIDKTRIIFLGTASQMPGPYRNVSAILISLPGGKYMLLDCGEGTYLQLLEHFGYDRIDNILENLVAIYITHFHGDHHLGLIELLSRRNSLKSKFDTFLIIPENMISWITCLEKFIEPLQTKILLNSDFSTEFKNTYKPTEMLISAQTLSKDPTGLRMDSEYSLSQISHEMSKLKDSLEYKSNLSLFKSKLAELNITIEAPLVIHCEYSYGIVIEQANKPLIAYSGDCRPSPDFISKAHNCSVCIHEATFNSDMLEKAKAFAHTTVKEAIEVGMQMNAWRTILTHFSQRYSKKNFLESEIEVLKGNGEEGILKYLKENCVFAIDHMDIDLAELEYYPELSQVIALMMPKDPVKENTDQE